MADTSDTLISVIPEVTPGVTPATPAFKNIRVTSETLTPAFETLVSAEIRADATVSDVRRSGISVSGDIGFELHRDAQFDDLLAAAVRGAWATNVAKGGTTNLQAVYEYAEPVTAVERIDGLRSWIAQYGIPRALYTDWKNVYVREPNAAEQATGAVPLTQFGRMCASLGIQIIAASSP